MRRFTDDELSTIELAYRTGASSVNAISKAHNIPEPSLRRLVKKHGWVRRSPETKRKIVSDGLAGVTKGMTSDEVRQNEESEAAVDILDMRTGLRVYRNILCAMAESSELMVNKPDPREAKIIVEAAEKAITGIREIRELNKTTTNHSDEELDAVIDSVLEGMAGGAKARPA